MNKLATVHCFAVICKHSKDLHVQNGREVRGERREARRHGEHMLAVVGVEVAADVELVRAPVVRGLPQQQPGQRPAAARRERLKHAPEQGQYIVLPG